MRIKAVGCAVLMVMIMWFGMEAFAQTPSYPGANNEGGANFGNHNDDVDVWFWQNKGVSKWDFNNGDSYTLDEGDLIYVPKGVYHKVSSVVARFGISMSRE